MKKKRTIDELKAAFEEAKDIAARSGGRGAEAIARSRRADLVNELSRGITTARLEKICNAEREARLEIKPKPLAAFDGEKCAECVCCGCENGADEETGEALCECKECDIYGQRVRKTCGTRKKGENGKV